MLSHGENGGKIEGAIVMISKGRERWRRNEADITQLTKHKTERIQEKPEKMDEMNDGK